MRKAIILFLAALLLNPSAAKGKEPPALSAECAVLAGMNGEILLEKNADARRLIASTTKLMTALVALEHSKLADEVEIPAACCGIEGSSMYLRAGETYTVRELLTGLLLASGNDAALALALHCGGSEDRFVTWMNEKAAALGMENSHFANPHGLDAEEHFSTALDMARLAAACLKNRELALIASTAAAELPGSALKNHNKLLKSCEGCIGLKTGYTSKAGRTLVSACERAGTTLVCVTLSDGEDWVDHEALYDWGFTRVRAVTAAGPGGPVYELPLLSGLSETVTVVPGAELRLLLEAGEELLLEPRLPRFVYAPVEKGQRLGSLAVLVNGETVARLPLLAAEAAPADPAERLGFWEVLRRAWYYACEHGGLSRLPAA